jgi:hypothetical protein
MDTNRRTSASPRVLCFISAALTFVYLLYCLVYWASALSSLGTLGITAFVLVMPHLALVLGGFICTLVAAFKKNQWLALAAGVCFVLAAASFPAYWWCVVVQAVLSFVVFYLLRRIRFTL